MRLNYLDLRSSQKKPVSRAIIIWRSFLRWWRVRKGRFSLVFAEALSAHILLFVFLILSQSSSLAQKNPYSNIDTIRHVLTELSHKRDSPEVESSAVVNIDELARKIDETVKFAAGIDKSQKSEIIKNIIRKALNRKSGSEGSSINVSGISLDEIQAELEEDQTVRLPSGEKAFSMENETAGEGISFYKLDKNRETQVRKFSALAGSEKESVRRFNDKVTLNSNPRVKNGVLSMPEEVYFRDCPYEQMLTRGASIFSVIKGFPILSSDSASGGREAIKKEKTTEPLSVSKTAFLTVYIIRPTSLNEFPAGGISGATANFSIEQIDKILDELMKLPDGQQFLSFEREFLGRYDPNSDDLARLTRRFVSTNLNGVFYLADDFLVTFDYLEELYFKRPIYDAFAAYWHMHPNTKAAAELIFSLADSYDFERRALVNLEAVYNDASEMLATGARKTEAYNYKVKSYVIKELTDEVRKRLKQSGFDSISVAARRYREESIAIFQILSLMGGELRDRALFALGQMDWEDGQIGKAITTWATIDAKYASPTFQLIRPYLGQTGEGLSLAVPKISAFLKGNASSGSGELLRRYLNFHKWATRAKTLE